MKYKIKISNLTPKISKDLLYKEHSYLGISINNPQLIGDHLELFIQWINKRFPYCKIIICDHLHRINEYIFNGTLDESVAIGESVKRGKIIADRFREVLAKYPKEKFDLEFWEGYYNDPECQAEKERLNRYFRNIGPFRRSIELSAIDFIDRQISRGCAISVDKETAIEKSVEYLIEEMAVCSVLVRRNLKVMIYPGTTASIFKELAEQKYPQIDTTLRNGVCLDLTVIKVK
jgi:tRNA-dependent cyclodipeptide synthase